MKSTTAVVLLLLFFVSLSLEMGEGKSIKPKKKIPNVCVKDEKLNCASLSNPKTNSGAPFYYFNEKDCLGSPKIRSKRCLKDTGCKMCYIPEIAQTLPIKQRVKGVDKCPKCVYEFWNLEDLKKKRKEIDSKDEL